MRLLHNFVSCMIDMNLPLVCQNATRAGSTGYHGKCHSPDGGRPCTKMKGSINCATVEATRPGTNTGKIIKGVETAPLSNQAQIIGARH